MLNNEQRRLVEDNQRLIFAVLNRKYPWLANNDDAISTANIGLCKAAKYFDPARGMKFSTLAWIAITNEIRMYLRNDMIRREHETDLIVSAADNPAVHEELDGLDIVEDETSELEFKRVEILKDFENVMNKLPKEWTDVVRDKMKGKTYYQIALEKGRSKQAIQQKFNRVIRILKKELIDYADN